jgi:L-asparagine transporter-like permease
MTPFLNNINHTTSSGRFIIATGYSAIGFGVFMLFIGIITGSTETIFNHYLPYLVIIHFPFWMLLVFSTNEVLRKRFGKMTEKYAGRRITLILVLLLIACLFIQADKSLLFSSMEILCVLLSLNLTAKNRKESDERNSLKK